MARPGVGVPTPSPFPGPFAQAISRQLALGGAGDRTHVASGPAVCLLFGSVKVELSHFAPNYFAVNLPDGSCPAVLIQHLTLSLFIDTSNSEVRSARLTTSQLGHLYDVTEAPCHVPRRAICPSATATTQLPATKLPFFFDLSGDRWQSIKYIISACHFILPPFLYVKGASFNKRFCSQVVPRDRLTTALFIFCLESWMMGTNGAFASRGCPIQKGGTWERPRADYQEVRTPKAAPSDVATYSHPDGILLGDGPSVSFGHLCVCRCVWRRRGACGACAVSTAIERVICPACSCLGPESSTFQGAPQSQASQDAWSF